MDQILTMGAEIRQHALFVPTLLLILMGTLPKVRSSHFIFGSNAMAAPTPVSTYFTLCNDSKAGIFLLARLLLFLQVQRFTTTSSPFYWFIYAVYGGLFAIF